MGPTTNFNPYNPPTHTGALESNHPPPASDISLNEKSRSTVDAYPGTRPEKQPSSKPTIRSLLKRSNADKSSVTAHNDEGSYYAWTKMALTQLSQDAAERRTFILKLAKALLSFGAPSHRIESQLAAASDILNAQAGRETFPCLFHWYLSASTRKNLFTYQTSSLLQYETETQGRQGRTSFALLVASL